MAISRLFAAVVAVGNCTARLPFFLLSKKQSGFERPTESDHTGASPSACISVLPALSYVRMVTRSSSDKPPMGERCRNPQPAAMIPTVLACIAATVGLSCGDTEANSQHEPNDTRSSRTRSYVAPLTGMSVYPSVYRHPLRADIPSLDGVPLLDSPDDPNSGGRFVVGDEIFVDSSGAVSQFSGVKTLYLDGGNERDPRSADPGGSTSGPAVDAPIIGMELATEMASLRAGESIEVDIALERSPDYVPLIYRMERAVAEGRVTTKADLAVERANFLSQQKAQVAVTVEPVIREIERRGGSVLSVCKAMPCLDARLTGAEIQALAQFPGVARIDAITPGHVNTISGAAVSKGTQMRTASASHDQFQEDDYLGEKSSEGLIRAGVIDLQRLDADHPGWDDWGGSSSRVASSRDCDGGCYDAI